MSPTCLKTAQLVWKEPYLSEKNMKRALLVWKEPYLSGKTLTNSLTCLKEHHTLQEKLQLLWTEPRLFWQKPYIWFCVGQDGVSLDASRCNTHCNTTILIQALCMVLCWTGWRVARRLVLVALVQLWFWARFVVQGSAGALVLLLVAVCCSVLQCVVQLCFLARFVVHRICMCSSVDVCCSVLQFVAITCRFILSTMPQVRNTLVQRKTIVQHISTAESHWKTLQHTAPHCNALQHTAPQYHTLQHTSTTCHTLQHTVSQVGDILILQSRALEPPAARRSRLLWCRAFRRQALVRHSECARLLRQQECCRRRWYSCVCVCGVCLCVSVCTCASRRCARLFCQKERVQSHRYGTSLSISFSFTLSFSLSLPLSLSRSHLRSLSFSLSLPLSLSLSLPLSLCVFFSSLSVCAARRSRLL